MNGQLLGSVPFGLQFDSTLVSKLYGNELAADKLNVGARLDSILREKKFTVSELLAQTPDDLVSIRNIGRKSRRELFECLVELSGDATRECLIIKSPEEYEKALARFNAGEGGGLVQLLSITTQVMIDILRSLRDKREEQ